MFNNNYSIQVNNFCNILINKIFLKMIMKNKLKYYKKSINK